MLYFYDGQLRRYLTQVIRLLSNFVVKYSDGTLVRVPVMYGDQDRQAASIINQNSENAVSSAPKIAVYISDLDLARDRLSDQTYVGKINIRERGIDEESGTYGYGQGNNYTVERLMPTPFDLSLKVDIWSTSTEQKLQILEQILVLFNPSLEIQTTDNYIDWTSLSVVELQDVVFSSRSVPVGTNSAIDIATLNFKTPIWLSPPAKVKKLGIITNIINNIYQNTSDPVLDYIDGLGNDPATGQIDPINKIFDNRVSIGNFDIIVEETIIRLYSNEVSPGTWLSWDMAIKQFPGKLTNGLSKIFLRQADNTEVVGTVSIHPTDLTLLVAAWDPDTFPSNTKLAGPVRLESDWGYFDAIVDPTTFNPKRPNKERTDQAIVPGTRYLVLDSIGGAVRDSFEPGVKTTIVHTSVLHKRVNDHRLLVNGVEVISNAQSNPTFVNVVSTAISGTGTNATFNVTQILSTSTYSAVVNNSGGNYQVGDKLRVRGKKLGGVNVANDCLITVMSVSGSGGITTIRVSGSSVDKDYVIIPLNPIIPSTDVDDPTIITYELNLNEDGPDAWKNLDGSDALAEANDIVEWDGDKWVVVFSAQEITETIVYQMNFYTRTQYKWNGVEWAKSFEGEYKRGQWRIAL
jgi:T4-like virus Myoviridae tail sheath stabiliser